MGLVRSALGVAGALVLTIASYAGGATPGVDRSDLDASCPACGDFYRFAAGGWLDRHPIPPDRTGFGAYDELAQRNERIAQQILEAAAENRAASGDEKKIGDLYASCVDEPAIERAGLAPIEGELDDVERVADAPSLLAALAHLHDAGIDALWRAAAAIDPGGGRRQVAIVAPGGFGLPDRSFYLGDDANALAVRAAYLRYAATAFALAGDDASRAERDAASVLGLETRLARAEGFGGDAWVGRERLDAIAPHVDWERYFRLRGFPPFEGLELSQPGYLQAADGLLASEPLDAIKTYLRWRILEAGAEGLPKRFADADLAFRTALTGIRTQLPRPVRCTRIVGRLMGDALGKLWVARAFSPAAKARAEELVEELRAALADELQAASWMSEATRRRALEKLTAMRALVGYPARWRDYRALRIARGAYLENVLAASALRVREGVAGIGRSVDTGEFAIGASSVGAYYSVARNLIVFPAGILQPPFFSPGGDDALNYGAIGTVIGHEMTHAFDGTGRQFDAEGNRRDWWTAADAENFSARERCVADQFGSYTVAGGAELDGRQVAGEALADLGGVTVAYRALERTLAAKPRITIDGFTPEQRFFLAFARSYAGSERPERERLLALTDPHPPQRFRVDGTLADVPEFAQAFGCVAGDAMVRSPAGRCTVW